MSGNSTDHAAAAGGDDSAIAGTITLLLHRATAGDAAANAELYRAAEARLRSIAAALLKRHRAVPDLGATALVNEAFVRGFSSRPPAAADRDQFFARFGCVMRDVLVDRIRHDRALKRGAGARHLQLDPLQLATDMNFEITLDAPECCAALAEICLIEPEGVTALVLHKVHGFSLDRVAEILGLTRKQVRGLTACTHLLFLERLGGDPPSE